VEVFTGKTALVTGASSGIGRAVALRLGEAGAHVFAAGRRAEALAALVEAIAAAGGAATPVAAELRDPGAVQGLVDRAMTDTGRLDVMVNNAGVSFRGPIADGDPVAWREMLEVNVLALAVGSRAAGQASRRPGVNPPRGDTGSRRAVILDAALRVFGQYGYRRSSMDDIAREAGIARGLQTGASSPAAYRRYLNALVRVMMAGLSPSTDKTGDLHAEHLAVRVGDAPTQPLQRMLGPHDADRNVGHPPGRNQ
jgi:NAD(P)-dependent dehydrogenase (short-subunit alcohol dehydrogenase family)